MEFNIFPLEVKQHIFHQLPVTKMLEVCAVCKDWDSAIAPLVPLRNVVLRVPYGAQFSGILTKTSRSYRAVELKIVDTSSRDNVDELYELVDVCKEKFDLKRMYLIISGADWLFELYESYRDVFSTLVELHVKLESCDCAERDEQCFELSLPNVTELSWQESKTCLNYPFPTKMNCVFSVTAPQLTKARVQHYSTVSYWDHYGSQDLPPNKRSTDHGSLVLLDSPKLACLDVTIGNKSLDRLLPNGLKSIKKLTLADASKVRLPWNETFSRLTTIETLHLHHCHPVVLEAALNHCKTLTSCQIITSDSTGLEEKIGKSWPRVMESCIMTSKCRYTDNITYWPYLALNHDLGRLVVASDDVVSDESFDPNDYEDDLDFL